MPIGWRPSPAEQARRQLEQPQPTQRELIGAAIGLVLFFALIALLPEFDGTHDQNWKQEDE